MGNVLLIIGMCWICNNELQSGYRSGGDTDFQGKWKDIHRKT